MGIFGDEIITIRDIKQGSFTIKSSKDIFGDTNKRITKDGREIISINKSKDIFGDVQVAIKNEADPETTAFLMRVLDNCGISFTIGRKIMKIIVAFPKQNSLQ